MQTFLPSSSYLYAAQYLDNKRLNKQILEGYQILKVLSTNGRAWRNHPAVLMWEGHEHSLRTYTLAMAKEAHLRGIKVDKNLQNIDDLTGMFEHTWGHEDPEWFKEPEITRVIATHRARLYIKDPIYYSKYAKMVDSPYNQPCCDGCNYYWPSHARRNNG